jgi:hypothetical protein
LTHQKIKVNHLPREVPRVSSDVHLPFLREKHYSARGWWADGDMMRKKLFERKTLFTYWYKNHRTGTKTVKDSYHRPGTKTEQ